MRAGSATAFGGIARRELLRFANQRERFLAALVRPLVWLFIFAAGFRSVLGLSITPPYQTYVLYEVYVTPGLVGMILLFSGMQSSLSMVYDRETGAMRTLLVSPYPRWFLLGSKLLAGVLVSVLQVYAFLFIAWLWGVEPPAIGYLTVLPALILAGLMLGSLGLLISSAIRQLENFAGVMNFVIFPMFFASTALYPLWRMRDSSVLLHDICAAEPVQPRGRAGPLRALRPVQPARLRRRRRLHRRLLRRHYLHVRSGQGPLAWPQGRSLMIRAALLGLVVAAPGLRRGAARPRLALHPAPPAVPVAGAGLGRAAARRGDAGARRDPRGAGRWRSSSRCAGPRWRTAEARIAAFAETHEPAALTALFVATLDHVNLRATG